MTIGIKSLKHLPARRVHHEKDGIHIFVNPHRGGKFVTNGTGAAVVGLVDRAADEEQLAALISHELGINPYEAAARSLTFYRHLEKNRMLGEAEAPGGTAACAGPEASAKTRMPAQGLPVPDTGFIEVTRECATRCRLCYVDSGDGRSDTMNKEEIVSVIDQMAEIGIGFIALSGGDPLMRDDLIEIIEYIAHKKHIRPGLSTSLLNLTEDTAKRMKGTGALVQVSLDGSRPEINDWNRGRGSFERVMAGVRLLNRHGIPFRFACVINKRNFGDVGGMVDLGLELGAREVAFGKVKIAGRAGAYKDEALPDSEQMSAAYHALYQKEVETRAKPIVVRCKHNQALLTGLQERVGRLPCGAGRTFIQVSHDGDIVPCSLLSNQREFSLGNVRTDALDDVWSSAPIYDFFRSTTAEDIAICRDCPAKNLCGGGCRADAYHESGDLFGPCSDCRDLVHYYDWILGRGCKRRNVTEF